MLVGLVDYNYYYNESGPVWVGSFRKEDMSRVIIMLQDDKLAPRMNILSEDYQDIYLKLKELNLLDSIIKIEPSLKDSLGRLTIRLYTKYPYEIGKIRYAIEDKITYVADVKWEKMVVQLMKWKQFFDIKDYDEYSFTPLKNMIPSNESFKINYNICYWDIETDDHGKVKRWWDWRNADKIDVISYVTINTHTELLTYYGWRSDWNDEIINDYHTSIIPKEIRDKMNNYPKKFKRVVKRFNKEKDMHKQFLDDFSYAEYDGIVTFNGRGGNRIVQKKIDGETKHVRQWFDGFDMPMFYERCLHLGIKESIQKMSPIPYKINNGDIYQPSVKPYNGYDELDNMIKHEIFIKCVPQHDLHFDDMVLKYSMGHHNMKRKRLEDFMQEFLLCGKVEHKLEGSVANLHKYHNEKAIAYNSVDVEGLFALNIILGYMDDVYGRTLLFAGQPEDAVYASKLHDHINLWFTSDDYVLNTKGVVFKDQWDGMIKEKVGGYNLPPITGVYGYNEIEFFAILDFHKLYPFNVCTANADLRTKINLKRMSLTKKGLMLIDGMDNEFLFNDCARSPAGFFRKDIESLNTIIYNTFIKERSVFAKLREKHLKDYSVTNSKESLIKSEVFNNRQFSYKNLTNGKFGGDGMEGSRSYDKVLYNTAPAMGQFLIKELLGDDEGCNDDDIAGLLNRMTYTPRFASTDSFIVKLISTNREDAWAESQELVKVVNKELDTIIMRDINPIKNWVSMGCEKVFDVMIMFDKRRYVMNTVVEDADGGPIFYDIPKITYKGLQIVRADSSQFITDFQKTIFQMICKRVPFQDIIDYILKIDSEWESYDWSYICKRSGISKNLDEVKGNVQKYKACKNGNKILNKEYGSGDAPLLGVFNVFPLHFNDTKIVENTGVKHLTMAFDEDDQKYLEDNNFVIDKDLLKKNSFVDIVNPILELFNTSYKETMLRKCGSVYD